MTNRNGRRLAYFYGRVSTEGQDQALSIGEQRKNASTIAGHEGFEIIRDFTEVRSAATDDRAVFQEMRSLAISPEHPVDAIFFNDLSRAFRDDEDFYINRRVFREAGVEIYTYEEGHLTEDDDSQLRFGFRSLLNSLVPRKTARETRRGQFGATNLGYYIGPDVFGYEKYKVVDEDATDTKKPVEHTKLRPHPTQWEHLLTMAGMALENRTPQRIADHLNALGVKTTKGKEWNEGSVLYVLRNPICRGKTHRGAHSKSRYLDRSQRARKENAHEAAMSDEDYETIEELIRLRTTYQGGPRVHSSPNPLSDHVICGICGWNMTLSRSKGITRLICSNKRKNKVKACPAENVRLDVLVPRVTAALLDRIITEQILRQQVTLVAETNREFLEEKQAARVTIQKNIEGTQAQISRLIDTIENRGGNPQIYERLDKRENEIRQLEVRLDGLDETFQDQLEFLNNPERIIACALDLRTYIESEDPEIARTFILSFVKKVVVLKKQATIHYTIPVPRGRRGNAEPTDTVNLEKNVVREESCLLPQRTGIHHSKRQLFVDTYHRSQRAGKEKKSGSRTNDAKQERPKKGTAPKERKEKRIPLTPEARKERQRTNHKEKLAKAKASGLCRHCGEPAIEGQTRCDRCAEKHRLSGRVYGIKSRTKAKEAREMAQAMAPAENIPAGGPTKCRECQNPPRPGQTRCDRCATRHNENRRRREAKKRAQAQNKDTPAERPR